MNPVKHVFDSQRHHFTKGGRFEKFYFVFENIESVFFAPAAVTSTGPHVRDSLDVKLSFLPSDGPPVFHGVSICVDENGDVGEGWSTSSGGNPSLAAQINSTYPLDGGSKQVELEGMGLQMVESQSQLDYQAVLTIIPR